MKHLYLVAMGLLAASLAACTQSVPQQNASNVLGTLEVSFDRVAGAHAQFYPAKLRTQGVLTESTLSFAATGAALVN